MKPYINARNTMNTLQHKEHNAYHVSQWNLMLTIKSWTNTIHRIQCMKYNANKAINRIQ